MSGFSHYLEAKILNWLKGNAFGAAPAAIFVALFSVAPLDDGTGGTDVTTTIRPAGRVAATFGAITGGTPSQIANDAQVDFGDAAGAVPDLVAFAIYDAAAAGNLLGSGPITPNVAIALGQPVKFDVGDLVVTQD